MERVRNSEMYKRDIGKLAVSMSSQEYVRECMRVCVDLSSFVDKKVLEADSKTVNDLLISRIADVLIAIDLIKYRNSLSDSSIDDCLRNNLFRKLRLVVSE